MSLIENAAERTNRNLRFLGNDSSVHNTASRSDELHVATLLARFDETCRLKPALDLAK